MRRGLDGAADDLFGVAQAVDGGGVDPVDAEIERAWIAAMESLSSWGPQELPVAAADGPGAEADGGELKVGVAEGPQCG